MHYKHILLAALLAAGSLSASATAGDPSADEFFQRADQMYSTGNYVGAIDQLGRYLNLTPAQLMAAHSDCEYAELLMLKARLQHGSIERALADANSFVVNNAGSIYVPEAQFVAAEALYHQGLYNRAIAIFEELPIGTFSPEDSNRAQFEYAVSLTQSGIYDKAQRIFRTLDDSDPDGEASFYIAYIDYVQGNLDAALDRFLSLDSEVAHRLGVDFFKSQIYFDKADYSYVLGTESYMLSAARRLQKSGSTHEAEAYRILGESAYNLSDLAKAKRDLTRHLELSQDGGSPSARYILGVMAYNEGNYTEVDEWLAPVIALENPMGQSATLYLGQSAARRGDNTSAAIYFDRAAHQTYDTNLAETALYNYAAAVAAGGRVPFGSASTLLEEFGERYPDSKYKAAVDKYLAIGYLAEKRYRKALDKLDGIKNPSSEVRALTLRTLYELGAQELAAGNAEQAEYYLRRASSYTSNDEVSVASRLWLAESLYSQKKYAEAVAAYKQFLNTAPSSNTSRAQAYYNLAYALYQQGDYKACRTALDNALKIKGNGALSQSLRTDALLRRADCDNYLGNVRDALNAYRDIATDSNGEAADYAALQAACMQGILGNQAAKRQELEQMLSKWPDSPWTQQAYYELVEACLSTDDFAGATAAQNRLASVASGSAILRESMLSMASAYYQAGKEADAITTYKKIISTWPSSTQAVTASSTLQTIYSRKGELNQLLEFLATVPGAPQPQASELDQLTYVNAVAAMDKNSLDTTPMEQYIARYPKGRYVADALLACASAYRESRNSDKALDAVNKLLYDYNDSDAALPALLLKANILAAAGDNEQASHAYSSLLTRGGAAYAPEAYFGLIVTTDDPNSKLSYIDKYLNLSILTADERAVANTVKADCLIALGRTSEALALLKSLSVDTSTPEGGAAAVKMAQIYLNEGNPKEAEKLMLKFTETGCDDIDTQALGYITLAEAYAAQGNNRLAHQYYESLQKNYPGENAEIISLIQTGLKSMSNKSNK